MPSLAERTFDLGAGSFPFKSRFLDVAGARIHYVDEGAGPVLLMLHGNPTGSYVFRHLIVALRDRFRCIALDYPGFGLSEAPAGYDFLPEHHAEIAGAFVDRLELASFSPVVQDWGGPIGFSVAGSRADRVERLIVGNTWCWPVNGDFHFEAFSRTMGGPLGLVGIRYFNAFVNLFVPAGVKRVPVTPEILAPYRRPLSTPQKRMPSYVFPRSIVRSKRFLERCEASLAKLSKKPALLLWGDADIAFRSQERERFERALPIHRTIVLRGAGHYIWEDAPDEIVSAVCDWWT